MAPRRSPLFRFLAPVLATFLLGGVGWASQGRKTPATAVASSKKPSVTSGEIAHAKAKGLVWVNTKSGVYHTGGRYYGRTRQGRFMSLADARKAGYRAPKRGSKSSSAKSAATSSEIAHARAKGLVWVNTKSGVYHTGGRYYGKTRRGRFMSRADARKAGYRAAKR